MSGPFKVGDVVCCINDGPGGPRSDFPGSPCALRRGTVLKVDRLDFSRDMLWLHFAGARGWFGSHRFRHLPKADEQFTAQMRAIKPVLRSVSA